MPKAKTRAAVAVTIPKFFYRRQEAAYALGKSLRAIDYMIADRRLITRRDGRNIVIPAAEVQRVAEEIMLHDNLQGVAPGRR